MGSESHRGQAGLGPRFFDSEVGERWSEYLFQMYCLFISFLFYYLFIYFGCPNQGLSPGPRQRKH